MNNQMHPSVILEPGQERILTVWLDAADRSVNVVDSEMLGSLEAVVEHLASLPERYRAVLFRSRKQTGFFAGADVHAMAALTSAAEVRAILERGQQLMQRLAALPMPTIAAIDGVCMGGGLEFALSCSHRLATDSPQTRLGLPEIRLGVLPAWGGTQRLPRLVGTRQALRMILQGSAVSASKALRLGLVDSLVAYDRWDEKLPILVERLAQGAGLGARRSPSLLDRFLDQTRLGRSLVLRAARRKVAKQAKHYPATTKAIQAVSLAMGRGDAGYAFEREAFSELLFTPTARSLLGLFVQRDRAKKTTTWVDVEGNLFAEKFARVAVIGAGAMGAGIGTLAASTGYEVVFKEIDAPALAAGRRRVEELLAEQQQRQHLRGDELKSISNRLTFTDNWEQLAGCELAIEAVLEIDAVKRDVFQRLDQILPAASVLVSNTSSLSVTNMAAATGRRGRVAGLHFFNPVHGMELVEVVSTEASDELTIKRLLQFVRGLGKTPIVTCDKPGFLVNRVLFPYLGEAVRMVSEGYAVDEIDQQLRAFGMPMGPLELIDQVGVDVANHVAHSLLAILPDANLPASTLSEMVGQGWLGKKSKLGFYDYSQPRRRKVNRQLSSRPRPAVAPLDVVADGLSDIQRRLVYSLLNEAVHCLDESVVAEAWMVDLGLVLGTGFAPMYGGPLRLIDKLGLATVRHNLLRLAEVYGERFRPADGVVRLAHAKGTFFNGESSQLGSRHQLVGHDQPVLPTP